MVDRYTKVVLTVIAVALVWLCLWGSGIPRGRVVHAEYPEMQDVNIAAVGHLPVTPPSNEARWPRHGLPVQEVSAPVTAIRPAPFKEGPASPRQICIKNFKITHTASTSYFAQNGEWPANITDMLPPGDPRATVPAGLIGGQLRYSPVCPFETPEEPRPYNLVKVHRDPADPTSPVVGLTVDWRDHWASHAWTLPRTEHLP